MGKNNVRFILEEVKNEFLKRNYLLLSDNYINAHQRLLGQTIEGYKFETNLNNIKTGQIPNNFDVHNSFSIENIKLWCKLNGKRFKLLSDQYSGGHIKLQWECLKETCSEIFEMSWSTVHSGSNCPFCRGLQVGLSNCLATKNPKLSKSWHLTKNGNLTPYDVTCGSNKRIWWICAKEDCRYEWEAIVASRNEGYGCPRCQARNLAIINATPSNFNNLLLINPKLCEEWDYSKNEKKPEEYCAGSRVKVWWKCSKCNYGWQADIGNRNKDRGCPRCNRSKLENEAIIYLEKNKINYIHQYRFKDCKNIRPLPFDFYLPEYNICIECNGLQHEKSIDYFGGEEGFQYRQQNDWIKTNYCFQNNIHLLCIPYAELNNIETILENYLLDKIKYMVDCQILK